jgi:5-(carboxyamino)imidazole ribonucleotide synthase
MYEKEISKPLRKLGHLNIVGTDRQSIDELLEQLEKIKSRVEVESI